MINSFVNLINLSTLSCSVLICFERETWLIEQILTNEINKQKSNYQVVREVSLCQPEPTRCWRSNYSLMCRSTPINFEFGCAPLNCCSAANKNAAPLPQMEK